MITADTHEPHRPPSKGPAIDPIALRVPDACRFLGIARSTLYVLIAKGQIEIVKLGSSTLVLTDSLRGLVERLRVPTEQAPEDPVT